MHCLYFIANNPQIMGLLSVYSQPGLLCALCKCVAEQTKRENTECVCPCLSGHTPPPLQALFLTLHRAQSHTVTAEISSMAASEWAVTLKHPHGAAPLLWFSFGNEGGGGLMYTGSSPHNLAWKLGLLFIWVKWTAHWPAYWQPCPDALALLLLKSSKSLSGTDYHPSQGKWVTYISLKPQSLFSSMQKQLTGTRHRVGSACFQKKKKH